MKHSFHALAFGFFSVILVYSSFGQIHTDELEVQTLNNPGNVGIGTNDPQQKLDIRGNIVLESGGSPVIYTGIGSSALDRYLQIINATQAASAAGLKVGGVLIADTYSYANPGKNDLIVKGKVGIGTASPTKTLEVNGTMKVTQATELKEVHLGPGYWKTYTYFNSGTIYSGSSSAIVTENQITASRGFRLLVRLVNSANSNFNRVDELIGACRHNAFSPYSAIHHVHSAWPNTGVNGEPNSVSYTIHPSPVGCTVKVTPNLQGYSSGSPMQYFVKVEVL